MGVQLHFNAAVDVDFHLSSPPCEKISLECEHLSWNKCMWPNLYHSKDNLGKSPQGRLTT